MGENHPYFLITNPAFDHPSLKKGGELRKKQNTLPLF